MNAAIEVSPETARRFVLGQQGLWPGRRWTGKSGTRAAIVACEHLQLDPLVIVARSHDLMLHSRVAGYEPRFFDALTYEQRLFFDWGGWLAVRSMAELPYWRTLMQRDKQSQRMQLIAEAHADAITEMERALREHGTLANRDIEASERRAIYGYRGGKESSLALYYLWQIGIAMTHHRNGFERVYAPTEAVAPSHLVTEADDDEADRFMVRKEIAYMGIGRPASYSRLLVRTMRTTEARALERDLVDAGTLTRVAVVGWRGEHFVLTSDLRRLDEVARGRVPKAWKPLGTTTDEEVTFLSPLDPVHARGRGKTLFDFDSLWEIYKRPDLVQYGRYTMPMLWGDRLVGRLDPRMDRQSGTLVINGIWFENKATARSFAFVDALRVGIRNLTDFLGADRVDVAAVAPVALRRALSY